MRTKHHPLPTQQLPSCFYQIRVLHHALWSVNFPWPDSNNPTSFPANRNTAKTVDGQLSVAGQQLWHSLSPPRNVARASNGQLSVARSLTPSSTINELLRSLPPTPPQPQNNEASSSMENRVERQQPPLQVGAGANDPGHVGSLPLSPANDLAGRDKLAANGRTVSGAIDQHPPTTGGFR